MPTDRIFSVKYLTDDEIRTEADRFRVEVWNKLPPVDSVYIADVVLGLDLIPIPDLFQNYRIDAALSKDLEALFVDEDTLKGYDKGLRWEERRLRFSIAHELCHYQLHAEAIRSYNFRDIHEYKEWLGNIRDHNSPEYQGDEFAGRFLVPRNLLIEKYDHFAEEAKRDNPNWSSIEEAREAMAMRIAPLFGGKPPSNRNPIRQGRYLAR